MEIFFLLVMNHLTFVNTVIQPFSVPEIIVFKSRETVRQFKGDFSVTQGMHFLSFPATMSQKRIEPSSHPTISFSAFTYMHLVIKSVSWI